MMDVKNVKVEGNSYVVPGVVGIIKSIYDGKKNQYDYECTSKFNIGGINWDITVRGKIVNTTNVYSLNKLTLIDKDTNEVYVDTKDVHGFMSKVCDAMGFSKNDKANMLNSVDNETFNTAIDAKEVYRAIASTGDVIENYKMVIGKDFCNAIYGYIKKLSIASA